MRSRSKIQGFTLLELSIVLMIIGLVVGGILIGQHLIRSSEIQSGITDIRQFTQAITAFQQKYQALPGDMATATNYWGTATGGCPLGSGTGPQTCNGNGNGQIADGVYAGSPTQAYEEFRAWQHLVNAQMVQGAYTGVAGSVGATDSIPGTNVPTSRIDNAGYSIEWIGIMSGDANFYDGTYNHVIMMAARNASTGIETTAVLTTAEALALDTKFDDGLPATGSITTWKPALLPNCATTSVSSTAAYMISSVGPQCALIFTTGF